MDLLYKYLTAFIILLIFSCPILFYRFVLGWPLENSTLPGVLTGIGIAITALVVLSIYAEKAVSSPDPNFSADKFIQERAPHDLLAIVKMREMEPKKDRYITYGDMATRSFSLFSPGFFLIDYDAGTGVLEYTITRGKTKFIRKWTHLSDAMLSIVTKEDGGLDDLERQGAQKVAEEMQK